MALHSAILSVTHNIPSFLREPAVALIGAECYQTLVYDFRITDGPCLKYALSKGLGLGIVLGGAIVKIPQILKITSSKSARGLSLSAYLLETAAYAISLAYASRNRFPFSTYGENLFLTVQNVAITLLILALSSTAEAMHGRMGLGVAATIVSAVFLWSSTLCPPWLLALLQASTVPLSLSSKVPQIISNHRARSTGNLSAFAVFNALLGCLARLFTTKQEVNDPLIFWGYAGAALFNAVITAQMIAYWRNDPGAKKRRSTEDGLNSGLGSPRKLD